MEKGEKKRMTFKVKLQMQIRLECLMQEGLDKKKKKGHHLPFLRFLLDRPLHIETKLKLVATG